MMNAQRKETPMSEWIPTDNGINYKKSQDDVVMEVDPGQKFVLLSQADLEAMLALYREGGG